MVEKKTSSTKTESNPQIKTVQSGDSSAGPMQADVGEEKVLLTWKAPVRPYKKRDREYYTTIAAIAFLVIIILAFLREFLLIAVVIAFAFVSYVFAAIPPEETEHQLTSRGVRSADRLYRWADLLQFWFTEKFGQKMVVVRTRVLFPGQLLLLLGKVDESKVRAIFNERLPHEAPEPTFMDKSSQWLSEKIPLEKEAAKPSGKSS